MFILDRLPGPSVTVTVDVSSSSNAEGAVSRAQAVAEQYMDHAWTTRTYLSANHHTVESGVQHATEYVERALAAPSGSGSMKPIVLAEITDNPGSGHYGDATNLLRAIVDSTLSDVVFYAIYDADAVLQGQALGVGNTGSVTLGGRHDPLCGGGPLTLTGKVVAITDGCMPSYGPIMGGIWQNLGLSMLFRTERNVDVILISNNAQLLDIAQITAMGVDPTHKRVIVVKSNHHFRASLTDMSGEIITVDGGGLGSMILKGGVYKNVRRPIWPLDDI
jgi:microcystin degradation protein MlrC